MQQDGLGKVARRLLRLACRYRVPGQEQGQEQGEEQGQGGRAAAGWHDLVM
jgi:hypothetical protein